MSLKVISEEIKKIISGQPSKQGTSNLDTILRNSSSISLQKYYTASNEEKLEMLTSLYFDIIHKFDKAKIKELNYVTEVLNKCDEQISEDGIRQIIQLYSQAEGKISIEQGIDVAIRFAITKKTHQFIIRGKEFRTNRISPDAIDIKVPIESNTSFEFGSKTDDKKHLSKVFIGINATLSIEFESSNARIYQHPVDDPNDFFYIEVHNYPLEEGNCFILNRTINLNVMNVTSLSISVKIQDENNDREVTHLEGFSIGSNQSDTYFYQSHQHLSFRIYKQNQTWYIINEHIQSPLMLSFHKFNNYQRNSKHIIISPSETKKVMIVGNIFQFTNESV